MKQVFHLNFLILILRVKMVLSMQRVVDIWLQKPARIRFWGVNSCFGANFPSHKNAEIIAKRLRKFGVNLVRFHHMDNRNAPDGIWQSSSLDRTLSTAQLERLDYFIFKLKEQGIYSDINLLVSRPFKSGNELPADSQKISDWKDRALVGFFDPAFLSLQKQYAYDLLIHINPYTGNSYCKEPALAFIEINNENGLVQGFLQGKLDKLPPYYEKELNTLWNNWLKKKYATHGLLKRAWHSITLEGGAEILADNDFSNPELYPWILEEHEQAQAQAANTTDGPDNSAAVKIEISKSSSEDWHVQFNQRGLKLKADIPYTLSFYAKASSEREIAVMIGMAHEPWQSLGFNMVIKLKPFWQRYEVSSLRLNRSDSNARLNFTNMGLTTGTVWISAVTLTEGGSLGLKPHENLEQGTIESVRFKASQRHTNETLKDWYDFLLQTEEQYWQSMKHYIVDTLKTESIVFGTVIGCSTPNLMAQFDVVDTHAYWQHPVFPNRPWDNADWYVKSIAMVNNPNQATILSLAAGRVLNKPHSVSEYNHPSPNPFEAECFFFLSAYGALQDWDVLIPFCYSHRLADWDTRQIKNYFDIDQNPNKLASFIPVAAANKRIVVPLKDQDEIAKMLNTYAWRLVDGRSMGLDPLLALTHRIELATQGSYIPAGALSYKLSPQSKDSFVSDTKQIIWDVSNEHRGVLTVDTAHTKYIVGYIGGREFELSGLSIAVKHTALNDFGVVALTVTQGTSFHKARRIIITALGAQYNTNSKWYTYPKRSISFPPAEGEKVTWSNNWGSAPTQVEGIIATITLPSTKASVKVWALDAKGKRNISVIVEDSIGNARFSLGSEYKTLWYEVEIVKR